MTKHPSIDKGKRGIYHLHNKLNDLTNKEWIKFTKSWFFCYPSKRKEKEKQHPAKFPEKLANEFIEFFTRKDEIVLDPFLGCGSTLIGCHQAKRQGIGIELQKRYYTLAKKNIQDTKNQTLILGNSSKISSIWKEKKLPNVDFIITSPPYGSMLTKELGEIVKLRTKEGKDLKYSEDKEDLGNIKNYDKFLNELTKVFVKLKNILKKDKYLVIVVQNYIEGKEYKTLAWDISAKLREHYTLKGERLWVQDHKSLMPYGYRYTFIPNIHHHYCLVFKNDK